MNKISCNVIGDLLPLYVDGAVSEDTKKLVEEHLAECEECKKAAEEMGKELVLPVHETVRAAETTARKGVSPHDNDRSDRRHAYASA